MKTENWLIAGISAIAGYFAYRWKNTEKYCSEWKKIAKDKNKIIDEYDKCLHDAEDYIRELKENDSYVDDEVEATAELLGEERFEVGSPEWKHAQELIKKANEIFSDNPQKFEIPENWQES